MKIVVCIRQSADGEINPFDASAYEAALTVKNAEVILLSMGPPKTEQFLEGLTRLGAKSAVLLTDNAFAGADTLATSYTLSLAISRIRPDLVICGRQSVDGDTGQVGPSLAVNTGYRLTANVMSIKSDGDSVICQTRTGNTEGLIFPAVITVEKSYKLRLPSIRSRKTSVEILSADDLGADISRIGLAGSPTRVIKAFENNEDRRSCSFVSADKLFCIIEKALEKGEKKVKPAFSEKRLKNVWIVGESPREMAEMVAESITVIQMDEPQLLAEKIKNGRPDAVLWGSDNVSKAIAPQAAALLKTGLCADCTLLETDGEELYMYRPACSGNVIAKIKCIASPPMATVRTVEADRKKIIIGIGYGAREYISEIKALAEKLNADIVATRKVVDNDILPYDIQVGLTGKTVSPDVYIAIGISGAVHHIAGIKKSGTVIAVNPDKNAPIFDYSDYGIVTEADEIL